MASTSGRILFSTTARWEGRVAMSTDTSTRPVRHAVTVISTDLSRKEQRRQRVAARKAALEFMRTEAVDSGDDGGLPGPRLKTAGRDGANRFRGGTEHFHVPVHRSGSPVLAAALPFLAESGLAVHGPGVGLDVNAGGLFCYDPFELYEAGVISSPNMVIVGEFGQGKSTCAKTIIARSLAYGRKAAVASDPKGEWVPVAEAVGGKAIQIGPGQTTRLNPLDEGHRPAGYSANEWVGVVTGRRRRLVGALATTLLSRPLLPKEHSALDIALSEETREARIPTVGGLTNRIWERAQTEQDTGDWGRDLGHALRRLTQGDLAGMFDGASTTSFDSNSPLVVIDTSRLQQAGDLALSLASTCSAAWLEAVVTDTSAGKRWLIYEEGWRMLRDEAQLNRMQEQWRLSRHWGLANMLIMHRVSDLDTAGDQGSKVRELALGLLSGAETKVVYRQDSMLVDRTVHDLGLTPEQGNVTRDVIKGRALWKVGKRAFVVDNFATVTAAERAVFDTDQRMVG